MTNQSQNKGGKKMYGSLIVILLMAVLCPLSSLAAGDAANTGQETVAGPVDNTALFESYTEAMEKIHKESGVSVDVLKGILASIEPGLSDDDPETTAEVLQAKAKDFTKIMGDLATYAGKDKEVLALHAQAKKALEQGKLPEAELLFIKARDTNMQKLDGKNDVLHRTLAAEDSATAAAVALLQVTYSSYRNAIGYYAEAAKIADPADPALARTYRMGQAGILDVLATDFWDAAALDDLSTLYPEILKGIDPKKEATLWGDTQNAYGIVLGDLAEQRGDRQLLTQAVDAHRKALQAYDKEKSGEEWAKTNALLGSSLKDLGSVEGDMEKLKEAALCFRAALSEQAMEKGSEDWVFLQSNLANVLLETGHRESGSGNLAAAVNVYREILAVPASEQEADDRASTQASLGLALRLLGSRENNAQNLKDSISAYKEALKIRTRENDPMLWAATLNSLGSSLVNLAEMEPKAAHLKEAISLYRSALEERTRDTVPTDWAATQNNLGLALHSLGQLEKNPKYLKQAEAAFRAALEIFTEQDALPINELVKKNLEETQALLQKSTKKKK